jgi:hypothetical protein
MMMKTEIFLSGHPDGRSPFFYEGDRSSPSAEYEMKAETMDQAGQSESALSDYRCAGRERLVFLPQFD